MKITRELKTGILVVTALILFVWGFNFLKGRDVFQKELKIFAYFNNVEGLTTASQVTFNGLSIGQVRSITYDAVKNQHMVEIKVSKDFPISKTSIAKIYEPGIMSGKQMMIVPNFNDKSIVKNGDIIKGDVEEGKITQVMNSIGPLSEKIEELVTNTNGLILNLNSVLDTDTKQNIQSSLSNLNKTLEEFSALAKDSKSLIANNKQVISNALQNLETTTENFKTFSNQLDELNVKKISQNLEANLQSINKLISDLEQGKGSLGKLFKDEKLYNNLTAASKELELLIADVKAQPKRYVSFSLIGGGRKNNAQPQTVRDSITILLD